MVARSDTTATFAEFFAGGGMAKLGLSEGWECVLANDIDARKCDTYRRNFGMDHLIEGDVAALPTDAIARDIDMWWASSPCQDFSLAGKGRGLAGARSGVFLDWIGVLDRAIEVGHGPRLICFENVAGLITRNGGKDFGFVLNAFIKRGYRVGALNLDARHFVPQSRPRLFVIALNQDIAIAPGLVGRGPQGAYHTPTIDGFVKKAQRTLGRHWVWWNLGNLPDNQIALAQITERRTKQPWLSHTQLDAMLAQMSPASRAKLEMLRKGRGWSIGTVYKRGRPGPGGGTIQRAELRSDGIAGCLRTPAGGSSRQIIVFVRGNETKARLLSRREAARLMGLPDSYHLPENYNESYKLAGDGVVVPVVGFLNERLLTPLIQGTRLQVVA